MERSSETTPESKPASPPVAGALLRYMAPIFLGAFLLFQVQPLIARYILPWFGGTPSVWTTCMLFFQVALLLGYAYAHLVVSRWAPRVQAVAHTLVLGGSLALVFLGARVWGAPILPGIAWKPEPGDEPVWHILQLLTVAVGLPYFVLATTSPLLQSWFSRAHPDRSPYRLYTLSNIGSLAALLSYPFIVEPALRLQSQANIWAFGYLAFCLAYAYCALDGIRARSPKDADAAASALAAAAEDAPPTWLRRAAWVALPALASLLLLAVTNELCQEVAVIPFLWILPLSLYLLSFIICFDNERWYSRDMFMLLLAIAVPLTAAFLARTGTTPMKLQILVHSTTLFICCMVCHGELVRLKPKPRHLTSFYLAVSIGGALGGVFVGAIAPLIFNWFWELPLGLSLAWGLGVFMVYARIGARRAYVRYLVLVPLIALAVAAGWQSTDVVQRRSDVMLITRNFYGVLTVLDEHTNDPELHKRTLVNGKITHGYQFQDPAKRRIPTSYYATNSGVALAILKHPRRLAPGLEGGLRIGVVGLGTGSLATYADKGDMIRFYDINPEVLRLAGPGGYFTYLQDCPAKWDVVLGDARLSLERELEAGEAQRFDVLVLDAFSSDAIPAHLLTQEAFDLYLKHLRGPESVLAVHISNKVLDLRPVIWGIAQHFGLSAAFIENSGDDKITCSSDWMLLSRGSVRADEARAEGDTVTDSPDVKPRRWTDDYHNLFQIMK